MGRLEEIGEISPQMPKGQFMPDTKLLAKPEKGGIFEDVTALTKEVVAENADLVKTAISLKSFYPDEVKKILDELDFCRGGAKSNMQRTLEELNLISEN